MKKEIYVRNLEKRDLQAIVNMEERQTGVARPDYWEKRLEISEAIRPHWASLVAELDNRVVGFVLGRAGEFEFGLPGTVAWIEIIGVDPAYRRQRTPAAERSDRSVGARIVFSIPIRSFPSESADRL